MTDSPYQDVRAAECRRGAEGGEPLDTNSPSGRLASPVFPIIFIRTGQVSLLALLLHWTFGWPWAGPHALGLIFTPLLCAYFIFAFIAPWAWGLPILTRLPTRSKSIALTFDDGPSPETTPAILYALQERGVHATFFVLGGAVQKYPELLRRIVAEGHAVGLHGFHHCALTLASWSQIRREIRQCAQAVRDACPDTPPPFWFRPPYGFKNLALPWLARSCGCRLVTWTLNPRDYLPQTPAQIAEAARAGLRPGAILLLHDGSANARTAEALPGILANIAQAGFQCVSLKDC